MADPKPALPADPASPREAFQVVFAIVALVSVAAGITLRQVRDPGVLEFSTDDPTPFGYTWSLLLFLAPLAALVWWFRRHPEYQLPRKALGRTLLVLVPLGVVLDLLFGHAFFTFPNRAATLGLMIPAVGGPIPIEEFLFYLSGFVLVLLTYIWADEYWLRAYNVPDYAEAARGIPRIVRFHLASVVVGAVLWVAAFAYKKIGSSSPEGGPWYFTYLLLASFIPSAGFLRTAENFINWRAFGFTLFCILLLSLLWEVTLALPYGWWGYEPRAMLGLGIRGWSNLPIEAVCVWVAVTFTTVITYEVIKIWLAAGRKAMDAFFGAC